MAAGSWLLTGKNVYVQEKGACIEWLWPSKNRTKWKIKNTSDTWRVKKKKKTLPKRTQVVPGGGTGSWTSSELDELTTETPAGVSSVSALSTHNITRKQLLSTQASLWHKQPLVTTRREYHRWTHSIFEAVCTCKLTLTVAQVTTLKDKKTKQNMYPVGKGLRMLNYLKTWLFDFI